METKICIHTKIGQVNIDPIRKRLVISKERFTTFKLIVLSNRGKFVIKVSDFYSINHDGSLGIDEIVWDFCYTPNGIRLKDEQNRFLKIGEIEEFFISKYSLSNRLGMTHWGGKYRLTNDDYLYEGAQSIRSMGINKLKIYLGLKSDGTYFTNYQNKSPSDIIQQDNYQRVLSMGFDLIVIICHAKPTSEWKFSDSPNIYSEETDELRKLSIELGKFENTEFIITNWEGDCMIGNDKEPLVYQRMIKWVQARQNGIDLANQKNVKHGIEVNFVRQSLPSIGNISVLTEVVPYTKTDYVSYSCYDCKNESEFEDSVKMISKLSNRPMIIGEFGTPVNIRSSSESLEYIRGIFNVCEKYHIKACFYWQIYENEFKRDGLGNLEPMGFGIIGHDSKVNGIWALLQYF